MEGGFALLHGIDPDLPPQDKRNLRYVVAPFEQRLALSDVECLSARSL